MRRDRLTGADLFLQDRSDGDLTLTRPPDREAHLQAVLPALQCWIDAEVTGLSNAELQALLPPLQSQLQAEYGAAAHLQAALPALVSQMEAAYDNAVWRGIESPACAWFQPGQAANRSTCAVQQDTLRIKPAACSPWREGARLRRQTCAPFAALRTSHWPIEALHQTAAPIHIRPCAGWDDLNRDRRPTACIPWQAAIPAAVTPCVGWIDLLRDARPRICGPFQPAVIRVRIWCGDWRDGLRTRRDVCNPWQTGILRYGWGGAIIIHVPQPPSETCEIVGRADLILRRDRDSVLILRRCRILAGETGPGAVGPTIYIPVARVYVVANDVHLIRVSDNLELPAFALSCAIDVDAWGWTFDAELPADQLANVQPGSSPVEVEVQINTYAWRFLVEEIRRTRSFGKSRIRIAGRSLAAELADPYSPLVNRKNTADMDATQILADLLTDNGVSIGWTIDWQLTDWTVTAGAWNHAGTYLEGVKKVAEAAGAIVQADRSARTLHLKHRYPVAPWDWPAAAPAYTIPEAIVVTEGVEWVEKPPYNAAYVSGENLGILGHVTRSGTAGDFAAPMVVHPLITHIEAARQRGMAILADTGKQAVYTLSMPIDPAGSGLGLLDLCQLIEYGPAAVRGLVRSVNVEARGARVRQTVTLETRP